jgi:hypothetical protein
MITVTVTGYGKYAVPGEKVDELIQWLRNNSMPTEGISTVPEGKTLLNESKSINPHPSGSPQHYIYNAKNK